MSLHSQVYHYIMKKIQDEEWPVGTKLPTEIELAQQFGISRPSVRTAMARLVNEGYLKRIKGKGTYVTKPKELEDSTIFIESFDKEMKKRGKKAASDVIEFRLMEAPEHVQNMLKLSPGETVLKLTRMRYIDNSFQEGPIVMTTSYFTKKLFFLQNYDFTKISIHAALAEHGIYRKRIEKHINIAELDNRCCHLMEIPEKTMALFIYSTVQDSDDDLVEYCESYYPAFRNEFILKIRI